MANVTGGQIKWNLDVDDTKYKSKMSNASKTAEKTKDSVSKSNVAAKNSFKKLSESVVSNMKTATTAVVDFGIKWGKRVGIAAAAATAFGLKTAGDFEQARSAFVGLLGSAEKADETMARIKREAATTPFELTGLTEGTKQLAAVTEDGNKAVDILLDVGKAITFY